MRDIIINALDKTICDFLYYDRKEDDRLKIGDIEEYIRCGDITVNQLCTYFRSKIKESL